MSFIFKRSQNISLKKTTVILKTNFFYYNFITKNLFSTRVRPAVSVQNSLHNIKNKRRALVVVKLKQSKSGRWRPLKTKHFYKKAKKKIIRIFRRKQKSKKGRIRRLYFKYFENIKPITFKQKLYSQHKVMFQEQNLFWKKKKKFTLKYWKFINTILHKFFKQQIQSFKSKNNKGAFYELFCKWELKIEKILNYIKFTKHIWMSRNLITKKRVLINHFAINNFFYVVCYYDLIKIKTHTLRISFRKRLRFFRMRKRIHKRRRRRTIIKRWKKRIAYKKKYPVVFCRFNRMVRKVVNVYKWVYLDDCLEYVEINYKVMGAMLLGLPGISGVASQAVLNRKHYTLLGSSVVKQY